jgi:membrane protein
MLGRFWSLLRDAGEGFVADDCLTRAGGIAYFTLFSIGPLLFIATGIAGLVVGRDQVDEAIAGQLASMVGTEAAGAVRGLADGALGDARGGWALAIGLATLLLTASGAFGALQGALNAVWKAKVPEADTAAETVSRFVRAKAAAIGLVATTGFILIASLAASAAIAALGDWLAAALPGGEILAFALNLSLTLAVLTLLFAAIYKVLPDRDIQWRDVAVGAFATALLFTAGKTLIATYIGTAGVAQGFGAAGTIVVVLVWLYYSSVIFLAGAEFTRAWANRRGSMQDAPVAARPEEEVAKNLVPPRRPRQPSPVALPVVLAALVRVALEPRRREATGKPARRSRFAAFNIFRKGVRA